MVVGNIRNKVSVAALGQLPSMNALKQIVQRSRNESMKALPNPQNLKDLIIPHRFQVRQKRGWFLFIRIGEQLRDNSAIYRAVT